ncbi:MAG: SpvB/TcaC N-terminal domain-containing protein, partial [Polyangiaceae bacterium]
MGESFSTDLSTCVASFNVPLQLVSARGGAQPSLSLHYSSDAGHGVAGVGWDIGVPFIARQTDRGNPQYKDPATGGWAATQDRFVYNGGQELVPICLVSGTACSGKLTGEVMPTWADGSQYFRPRIEGSYLRFFWSPNHKTWRVQSKSGENMEFGAPLDGSGDTSGLESDPSNSSHVFRWNLVRQYDAYGDGANPPDATTLPTPLNPVVYRYLADGSMTYLSDIYDTSPASNPTKASLSAYAHHTHLAYDSRPDTSFSFRRGWRVDQNGASGFRVGAEWQFRASAGGRIEIQLAAV